MAVRRITVNLETREPEKVAAFYRDVFDLDEVMNFGWIVTLQGQDSGPPQLSTASEGGSGTAVPYLSIDVDDVDAVMNRARGLGHEIEYGPVDEPWGVRRFFMRDPAGNLLNILSHSAAAGAS